MDRRQFLSAVGVATGVSVAGCGATVDQEEVIVGPDGDARFDPADLTIESGTTVTFIWDSGGHNLVPTSQPTDSDFEGVEDTQDEGYEHDFTFLVGGTTEFVCEPHEDEGMTGTIEIEGGEDLD